jgi:hypothetical protein
MGRVYRTHGVDEEYMEDFGKKARRKETTRVVWT